MKRKPHSLMAALLSVVAFFSLLFSAAKCSDEKNDREGDTNESQYPTSAEPETAVYYGPQYYEEESAEEQYPDSAGSEENLTLYAGPDYFEGKE